VGDPNRHVHAFLDQIDKAIRVHDKLLLVLSKASMASDWVKHEVSKAIEREKVEKRQGVSVSQRQRLPPSSDALRPSNRLVTVELVVLGALAATASETPRIALAPRRALLGVPSSAIIVSSILLWASASMPPIAV
jgi:hypothetical protein